MLKQAREGRVLRLTLARPEKRNALHSELCARLVSAVESAWDDGSIGAILLDAEGLAFCAGMDLEEALLPDAARRNAIHEKLFSLGSRARKPLVAAVQGAALAGGLGLVSNAHVVVAAEEARFGVTELRVGMWPFLLWASMAEAIGARRMLELSLTARIFSAAEALSWGLVHVVVPHAAVGARALEIAREISEASPEAIRRGFAGIAAPSQSEALRAEQLAGADFREGVRAFLEKRPPRWPSIGSV